MLKKVKNPVVLAHKLGSVKNLKRPYNNSLSNQRARIISWFNQNKPRLSTIEAREILGILHPAARVQELKKLGHKIILNWVKQADATGILHRVGEYIYLGQKEGVMLNSSAMRWAKDQVASKDAKKEATWHE